MVKTKKVATDLIYSISAVALMNVVLQFIVYPIVNKNIGESAFGEMLYFLGVVNILAPSFGLAANNGRLLMPNRDSMPNGDFIAVMSVFSILSVIVGSIVSAFRGISLGNAALFLYIIVITAFRNYVGVEFRLTLNYKKQFIFYSILSLGYIAGMLALLAGARWEFIFILGETAAVGFVVWRGSIFSNWRVRSARYKEALKNAFTLSINYLITNLMLNLDRMVLLSLVGSEAVSQYYVLSLMGKTISIVSGPVNGILIGYLTKGGKRLDRTSFIKASGILLGIGVVFWAACSIATPIFIRIMYPDMYTDVISLNMLVNLSQIIYFLTGVLVVIVLTVSTPKCVLRNQVVYSVVFIALAFALTGQFGINGFTYAAVISNTVYFCLMFKTGFLATKQEKTIAETSSEFQ